MPAPLPPRRSRVVRDRPLCAIDGCNTEAETARRDDDGFVTDYLCPSHDLRYENDGNAGSGFRMGDSERSRWERLRRRWLRRLGVARAG